MLELHYYADPMIEWFGAVAANRSLLTDANLETDAVVIDAGAYVGEWVAQIADRYGCTVYAFEPGPGFFTQLEAAVGDRPHVHLFDHGLGAEDTRSRLALDGPGSSIYADVAPRAGGRAGSMGEVDVEIRDVATALDRLGLERIDLLKLNIEGAEYDVIERLVQTGWLPRIDQILVQFHEWHPHAHRRRRAIRAALARDHVEQWNYPWVWERWCLRER